MGPATDPEPLLEWQGYFVSPAPTPAASDGRSLE